VRRQLLYAEIAQKSMLFLEISSLKKELSQYFGASACGPYSKEKIEISKDVNHSTFNPL